MRAGLPEGRIGRTTALDETAREARRLILGGLSSDQVDSIASQAATRGMTCQLVDKPNDFVLTSTPCMLLLGAQTGVSLARQGWLNLVAEGQATILIDAEASLERAVEAMRHGFRDYIDWPQAFDALWPAIDRYTSGSFVSARASECPLLHRSSIMAQAVGALRRLAGRDCTVLITGETGTGKELAAELIHTQSSRCKGPLVRLNCAALPEGMIEAELFGYERGAFTGAVKAFPGRLVEADGGTLFLDEIGEMPLLTQVRLLRVLEAREVMALGKRGARPIDIRIVAATNQTLETLVTQRRFREDLFWRLNVAQVRLPSLRERIEDVPLIAQHFLRLMARSSVMGFVAPAALAAMERYSWPGNVRELRNVIEHAAAVGDGRSVTLADLPVRIVSPQAAQSPSDVSHTAERERLLEALMRLHWNKTKVARSLNWSRMTLYRKLRAHGIEEIA